MDGPLRSGGAARPYPPRLVPAAARVRFQPSDEVLPVALAILDQVRAELRGSLPTAELLLTGSASRSGMLTRGDIDLHLRLPAADVEGAVAVLEGAWTPVHRSMWTPGFVTFERSIDGHEVGVAVTALGDEHDDRFRASWERLAADPELAEAYDRLKREHEGGPAAAYGEAKARFFGELATVSRPAGRR